MLMKSQQILRQMSFLKMRWGGRASDEPPALLRLAKGVRTGAPLTEVLQRVAQGDATPEAGAEALRTERLELSDADVGGREASVMELFRGADAVDFYNVRFKGNAFHKLCNGVAQSTRLREVRLARCGVGDDDAFMLVKACIAAGVTTLDVSGNALRTPVQALERLKGHQKLKGLRIEGNRLTPDCVQQLEAACAGHWPALVYVSADSAALADAVADGNARLGRAARFVTPAGA